jgi:HSP20 family molecular chaperone IbpA
MLNIPRPPQSGELPPGRPVGRRALGVRDDGAAIVIRAALGFEADDYDLQVYGGRLVLHATRRAPAGAGRRECHETVPLPAGVDPTRLRADYADGVLTVVLPKRPGARGPCPPLLN